MKQYLDLVAHVIKNGTKQANRTGVNTISVPGAMLRYDLKEGFPAITTRRMAFKSAIGEMCGFLRGVNNAAYGLRGIRAATSGAGRVCIHP